MSPQQAYDSNEKLFPVFETHLSDVAFGGNYAPSAEKFADWLSKDRAYYTAARPWIVRLVERAQITIREVGKRLLPHDKPFHVSQCPEELKYWLVPYEKLVRTVRLFEHLFVEPDLRTRLQALVDSVELPRVPTPQDAQSTSPFVIQHPPKSTPAPTSTSTLRSMPAPRKTPAVTSAPPSTNQLPHLPGISSPSSSTPRVALAALNTGVRSTILIDVPQVASPEAMTPVDTLQPVVVSHPGSAQSASTTPAHVHAASVSRPPSRVESAPLPASTVSPSTTNTSTKSPDLGQMFSEFAKKDLEWVARHSRSLGQSTIQSRTLSASTPILSPSSSNSPTPPTTSSVPVKKKSKSKSLLSKGFLDADVEWYQQQQNPKQDTGLSGDAAPEVVVPTKANPTQRSPVASEPTGIVGDTEASTVPETATDAGEQMSVSGAEASTVPEAATNAGEQVSIGDAEASTVPAAATDAGEQASRELTSVMGDTEASAPPEVVTDPGEQGTAALEEPPSSRSPTPSSGPAESPHCPESPDARNETPTHMTSSGEPRELDLSKIRTPKPKSKRGPADFAFTKVAHTPDSSIATSITSRRSTSPLVGSSDIQATAKTDFLTPRTQETTVLSHKVKSKKKGPPGIKASEFSPLPSTSSTALPPTSPRPVVKIKLKKGPPGVKILPPQETSSSTVSAQPSSPPVQSSMMDVDPESPGTNKTPTTNGKHVTFQPTPPESLKRARSRSPSIPLSHQRRKVTPTSVPSTSLSSKVPSENAPRAVRSTPREYSVAAFDSGNYVYSPVRPSFEPVTAPRLQTPKSSDAVAAPLQERQGHSSKGSSKPKAAYSRISWQSVGVVVPTDEELVHMPLFSDDSVVLGSARGQPSGIWKPVSFEFELDEEMFKALSLWNTRISHKEDLSSARCLSLACHKFSDCVDALKSAADAAKKHPFTGRPVEWPLIPPSVCINDGQTQARRFAISSWVTDADHIVDISKRVQPGRNIVQLLRPLYPSPSVNYVFILRFHPPTPRQSAEVMKQRGNNLAWDKLLVWCAQIDIPELDYDIHGA